MKKIAILAAAATAALPVGAALAQTGPPSGLPTGPPAAVPTGAPEGIPTGPPSGVPALSAVLNGPPASLDVEVAFVVRGTAAAAGTATELQVSVEGGNAHARRALDGASSTTIALDAETAITRDDAGVGGASIATGDSVLVVIRAPFNSAAADLPAADRVVVRNRPAGTEDEEPEAGSTAAAQAGVTLSASQLRINQRVSQAALRRANAALAVLNGDPLPAQASDRARAAIELSAAQLRVNQRIAQAAVLRANAASALLDGLPVPSVTLPEADPNAEFALNAAQLLINQRISQAAVRRANAVDAQLAVIRDVVGDLAG